MSLSRDVERICLDFLPPKFKLYVNGAADLIPNKAEFGAQHALLDIVDPTFTALNAACNIRVARCILNRMAPEVLCSVASLELLIYMHKRGCWWTDTLLCRLASEGRADMLWFALSKKRDADTWRALRYAAMGGHLDCVRLLLKDKDCANCFEMCRDAAGGGHCHILQYARERGATFSKAHMLAAIDCGRLRCVEYMHAQGVAWCDMLWDRAILAQCTDIIRHMVATGYVADPDSCNHAAYYGRVAALECLHSLGFRWTAKTCATAALWHYNFPVLQYLHDNGCEWDVRTCDSAVVANNVRALQYARERGCPWTLDTAVLGARHADAATTAYLLNNNCEWHPRLYTEALDNDNHAFISHALSLKKPADETVRRRVEAQWPHLTSLFEGAAVF